MANRKAMVFTDTNVIAVGMPAVLVIPGVAKAVKGGKVQVVDSRETVFTVDPRYISYLPTGITFSPQKAEKIKEEKEGGGWICICKNTDSSGGVYACDSQGNEIELLENSGWNDLMGCADCGRIINQNTLKVMGRNPKPRLLP